MIVGPWKFNILKTSLVYMPEKRLLKHQISAWQLSADSSSTETLYYLNRNTSEFGVREMLWEHQSQTSVFTTFSSSPKL